MPCTDGGPSERECLADARQEIKLLEAALCMVLTKAQGNQHFDWNMYDWEEAGIQRVWLLEWWKEHKRKDEARKRREARERREAKKHKAALAKLTKEERRLLGLREE
jgi:hypothetical protein